MEKLMEKVGVWSFYTGLAIAVISAIMSSSGMGAGTALLLGALGILVGLLNVTGGETKLFLVATIAFMVGASSLGGLLKVIPSVGAFIPAFLDGVIVFVAPSAAIVALKAIYDITRSK